ncbi:MAG: 4-hydroxy-tetrahydrodipicolinate reductase [Clostridia bacterium]|nr:4-hydroxy-tetrahydrodipicolinate reductase [Clostridia bacterium]MBO7288948.1 4-hydroxy-tetrahydrodipicolinate reductase [Clostridia bacterium]
MIKIALFGCNGKMGQVISNLLANDEDAKISFGFDINTEKKNSYPVYDNIEKIKEDADVVIDFSHPALLDSIIEYCKKTKTGAVIATTGLLDEQIKEIDDLSKEVAIFRSANMSLGINLLISLVKKASQLLGDKFDIEIIEKHHNQKIDAPSGTALMIADAISDTLHNDTEYVYDRHSVRKKRAKNEIGLHAVRGGTIVGEHDVIFAGNDEIIEINHKAMSKEIFAVGSIKAAKYIAGKKCGMYSMANMIED